MKTATSLPESYLQHERLLGKSPASIRAYRGAIRRFARFTEARELRELTPQDIGRYAAQARQTLSEETAYLYVRTIKCMFRYLADHHLLLLDPADSLALPKLRRKRARPIFSFEQIEALIKAPDLSKHVGMRDRAMLEVCYSCVPRISELRAIQMEDLDLSGRVLAIRKGKGKKDRMVPVGEVAAGWLDRYLSKTRPVLIQRRPNEEALFVSRWGNPFSKAVLEQHFQKLGRRAGLPLTPTCHVFRRTVATRMLEAGASPKVVADLLGHEDLRSLYRYVSTLKTDVKETHDGAHPRNRDA